MKERTVHIAALLLVLIIPAGAAEAYEEYRVKSEFVERFTRFIWWPKRALEDSKTPFVIGIVGRKDPIIPYLRKMARARRIKDRPIRIRVITALSQIDRCQILWISQRRPWELSAILARTRDKPILTISDSKDFAQDGGHINIIRRGIRLGFAINLKITRESGLRMSAKLLRLGRIVGPRTRR